VKRSGRGVRVTGEARADVLQTCIVSLEPFPAHVVEEVDVRFAPPSAERRKPSPEGEEIRFDAEDEPDPLIDNTVDLGEVADAHHVPGIDFGLERAALANLAEEGLVEISGNNVTVPESMRPFVRKVASVFDALQVRSATHAAVV